jgi:hypothetical protein
MVGDRWGVADSETVRPYPCDDFVVSPTLQAWRGVSVEAPAEAVWAASKGVVYDGPGSGRVVR